MKWPYFTFAAECRFHSRKAKKIRHRKSFLIGTATSGRSWKIKVTCLDCESENLADNGCLQWYTSHSGRIRSFNSQNAMIHNQQYSICIKQEEGMCAFELSETQTTNTPRAFALDATNTAAKQTGATCTQHMIIVKGTSATASDDVFCGGRLSETSAQTTSGTIRSKFLS